MIEEDSVVLSVGQAFLGLIDRFGDYEIVALKSFFEPRVTAVIVVQKKNRDRRPFGGNIGKAELYQQTAQNSHR